MGSMWGSRGVRHTPPTLWQRSWPGGTGSNGNSGRRIWSPGHVFTTVGRAGRIGNDALTPSAISVMVQTRMAEAGIEGHWSGRSLRRGFISTAADLGLRLEDIAKGSRHATLDSLIRYIANDDPFRDNPTAQMGL